MSTTPIEQHVIVRRRTFTITYPAPPALADLIYALHIERATGKLTINLSQGAVQSAQFEESQQIKLT